MIFEIILKRCVAFMFSYPLAKSRVTSVLSVVIHHAVYDFLSADKHHDALGSGDTRIEKVAVYKHMRCIVHRNNNNRELTTLTFVNGYAIGKLYFLGNILEFVHNLTLIVHDGYGF